MNIRLEDHATSVIVAPQQGGAVMMYRTLRAGQVHDWMVQGGAEHPSCFAMLPWCSRIRNGCFSFQGRNVALPANNPPEPHSIHGHGWQQPWTVVSTAAASVLLEYQHMADAWPWPYVARQQIDLQDMALQFTVSLENCGSEPMPAGMGLHPFFSVTPGARISTEVSQRWILDRQLRSPRRAAMTPGESLSSLALDGLVIDAVYSGWQRELLLTLPEWQAQLQITATEPFNHLILYTPGTADPPFICAEPVSNVADAFNLAADPGGLFQVLAPGATLTGSVLISPRFSTGAEAD